MDAALGKSPLLVNRKLRPHPILTAEAPCVGVNSSKADTGLRPQAVRNS